MTGLVYAHYMLGFTKTSYSFIQLMQNNENILKKYMRPRGQSLRGRGHDLRGRGQDQLSRGRGRGRIFRPRGRGRNEDLTSLIYTAVLIVRL